MISPKNVLIVGAGPVGCYVAYRLGKAGIQVDILEKEPVLVYTPRAVGYYGATQIALQEAGLYDLIRKEGFMTSGLCWRKLPVTDDNGDKSLGEMFARLPMCSPGDKDLAFPSGLLNLRQSDLAKLLLRESLATGNVKIHFNTEVTEIEDGQTGVNVTAQHPETKIISHFHGSYVVGTDGGRSTVRKLIGTTAAGHTWPERILATDVMLWNKVDPVYHTAYIMGTKNFTIMTPLTEPVLGQKSLWRCGISIPPEDNRSEEELTREETIREFYEEVVAGPRPLDVEIQHRTVYRIHQRLAATMRKGRTILAGDAAHMNNPYGAMGLNTGLLDGDALAEALIMVILENRSDAILTLYSDERRKVFQYFVNPTSSENKLRLQYPSVEEARVDDYFFREMYDPTSEELLANSEPYFKRWRTDIRAAASLRGL